MKKIKGLLTTVLLLIPILLTMETMSLAAAANGPYLMMYKKSNSRKSIASNKQSTDYYAINTVEDMTFGKPAIKLVRTSDSSGSSQIDSSYNEAIYCIYGGQGFGAGSTNQVVKYTQKFNMRNPSEITSTYDKWNITSSTSNYPKIMWVLDNLCIPSDNDSRSALLTKAGVSFAGTGFSEDKINDIIESVQQAAIWYFTNPSGEFHPVEPSNFVLQVGSVSNHVQVFEDDMTGMDPAKKLYKYFIDNAKNQGSYDYAKVGAKPLTYAKGFTTATAPTTKISSDGTKYIIGPYLINKDTTKSYDTFTATITDGTNAITDAKIVNASGTELSGSDISAKIAGSFGTEFYISVPIASVTSSVKLDVSSKYSVRTITYWWASNTSQPVAIIEPTTDNNNGTSTVTPTPPTFDLALRKFITKVTNSSGTTKTIANIERTPDVDESTLTSGTTATYKHRKDPVKVETGDIVTYKLRIYNEGSAIGRATKIVDQLPTGLTIKTTGTVTSSKGNKYTISNNATSNTVTLTTTDTHNLPAYTANSLKNGTGYDEITIECTVTGEADTSNKKVLTNIAWISEQYNVATGETITNQSGKDRDSVPNTHPTANKDGMANYTGNGNKENLADKTYYYKGQQDDDDFEKLVIDPVQQEPDLALRKWISAMGNENGDMINKVFRTIEVDESPLKNATGTTAIYKHSKNAIEVETGYHVYYNLRIYNEGAVAARATQITDQLPEGLEFEEITSGNFDKTSYDKTSNILVLTRKSGNTTNLPAYTEGSLQEAGNGHETITLRCKVTATYGSSNGKDLTNIAWISKQVLENGQEITKDIDSEPGKKPNVNKNSNDYKGTTSETDLSKQIYYPGQEDDDDFEKIIVARKTFDLALRKFISKVTSSSGATKTIANLDKRIPNVDESSLKSGTTATYKHRKNPVSVETGDVVTYKLRIYNEGSAIGRATKIIDQLPEGVTLKTSGTVTSSKGNAYTISNSNNRVTLTTTGTNNIPAYTANSLKNETGYDEITIECTVTANPNTTDKVLTNVAWISEAFNASSNETITNQSGKDRDSIPNANNHYPSVNKDNMSDYKGTTTETNLSKDIYYPGQEDDDDFEKLILESKQFDLALRKFITKVTSSNGKEKTIESREPEITQAFLQALANGTATFDGTTTNKTHKKDQIEITNGSKIVYTIRIYNEGQVDGKATEITDYLPEGLSLAENSQINQTYGWKADQNDSKKITTDYLKNTTLKAFNTTPTNGQYIMTKDGGQIADVQIECVVNTTELGKSLKNVAEITSSENEWNIPDRDSTAKNITDDQKGDKYNPGTSTQGKGYEDDDDYEDLKLVKFDLALRKFITGVNDEEITNREPEVDTSKYGTKGSDGKEITTFTYNHTKEPVKVEHNDTVIYTIRVYNEGNTGGYADLIKDDIPEGLEFLPDHEINKTTYKWKMLDESGKVTTDVSKAKYITTDALAKKGQSTDNLLKAYSSDMEEPDYRDVKVAFKVTEPNTSDRIITNKAQISKHSDKDGNDITDIDSTPDKWNEGEDDQDVEHIYVKYFDLSLRKWVTHAIVIEDGEQKEMETGHKAEDDPESIVKVELNKKRLENTVVKFRYSIRITNEGEIAGYATEISDYIPNGLRFNQADNPKWKEVNGKIVTDQLKDTLLQPGQNATVDVLLTWINDEKNMRVMQNVAEISEDKNDSNTPDIDSKPNNQKDGEDDIDDAPVALTVVTGSAPTYIAIATGVVLIIGGSVFFIKKYIV